MEHLARFTREDAGGAWRVIARPGLTSGQKVDVAKRGKVATVTVGEVVRTLSSGECVYAILRRTQAKAETTTGDHVREAQARIEAARVKAAEAEQKALNMGALVESGQVDAGHNIHGGIATNGADKMAQASGSVDAAVKALIEATQAQAKAQEIDEARIVALIEKHATKTVRTEVTVNLTKQGQETKVISGQHKLFGKLLQVVSLGLPVMLVGPAGSGKTSAAQAVAKELGKPFLFTGAVADRFALLGFRDGHGQVVETQFSRAIKQACVFLWDELDGSAEDALLSFHAPIDNRIADMPEGRVDVHEGCSFIASANTYGRGADRLYVGRTQLDAATLDRFVMLEWDYDSDLEARICGNAGWVARVQAVREACANLKVRHVVSMRATFQGAAMLADGMSQKDVETMVLWRGLDSDSRAKVERAS